MHNVRGLLDDQLKNFQQQRQVFFFQDALLFAPAKRGELRKVQQGHQQCRPKCQWRNIADDFIE